MQRLLYKFLEFGNEKGAAFYIFLKIRTVMRWSLYRIKNVGMLHFFMFSKIGNDNNYGITSNGFNSYDFYDFRQGLSQKQYSDRKKNDVQ